MKKTLLATTALAALGAVAVAGPAMAAEKIKISVGGYMEQWFGYADSDLANTSGFDQKSDGEIHFKGSTTLDNGIKIGVNVQLEAQQSGDQIDEQFVYVEGSFGRINLGGENAANYLMHYGIPSMGTGLDSGDASSWISGTDFTAHTTNGRGPDNDSEKLTYFTPRFSGFQLGVSYIPEVNQDADGAPNTNNGVRNDALSVAANFKKSIGDVKVAASAGYTDFGDDDGADATGSLESYQVGLRLGFGGFGVAGTYGENDRTAAGTQSFAGKMETVGFGVNYAAGPMGISLGWIGSDNDKLDDDQDVVELGAKYAIGPGVTLKGSVYYVEREVAGVETAKGMAVNAGMALGF